MHCCVTDDSVCKSTCMGQPLGHEMSRTGFIVVQQMFMSMYTRLCEDVKRFLENCENVQDDVYGIVTRQKNNR